MQRTIISTFIMSGLLCLGVWAGEAQGTITAINAETMVITLDNGETYLLPPEFDVSLVSTGMVVALAHEDDAGKTVTDMELID